MFSFLGWLSYTVQRVSLAPLHTRLFVFSGVSCADVILGACCYRLASSAPWSTCFLKSYGVLFRVPGIGVVAEATLLAAIVLNVLFIFSNFVFAALLGLISDEIKQQLHAIRVGEVTLPLRNHILVLNYNQTSLSVLKQLSSAQSDPRSRLFKRPVVVLAEQSKQSLDAAVAAAFKGTHLRVFCRSGRPSRARDLERVAAESASTVIVMQPDASTPAAADALKATALVSLSCLRERAMGRTQQQPSPASRVCSVAAGMWRWLARASGNSHLGGASSADSSMRIVVQVERSSPSSAQQGEGVIGFLQCAMASSMHSGTIQQVQGLLSQSTLDRLVCQTAVQPGVATVFRELMRAGGGVRLAWVPVGEELVGSYGRAAGLLQPGSVLLGVLPAESKQLVLNPADVLLLQPEDRLVVLTRQGSCFSPAPAAGSEPQQPQRGVNRTVSRVSSMASPQLCLPTTRSSSDGGCASPAREGRASRTPGSGSSSRGLRIILLGVPESGVPDLLSQLQQDFAPLGSSVTVVLPAAVDGSSSAEQTSTATTTAFSSKLKSAQDSSLPIPAVPGQHTTVLRVKEPSSVQALLSAGIADADAVILGSQLCDKPAAAAAEADAMVTAAMLAIQQALQQSASSRSGTDTTAAAAGAGQQTGAAAPSRLHVVAVVTSYSVRRALQSFLSSVLLSCSFSYEVMVLDEFAAGMLVSVAEEVDNAHVIEQLLLQPCSSALCITSLARLGLHPDTQGITFSEVQQAARQQRVTAIGYRRADGRMVLVPEQGSVALGPGDRIVVLDAHRGGGVGVHRS